MRRGGGETTLRAVAVVLLGMVLATLGAGCASTGGGGGSGRTEEVDRSLERQYPEDRYLWAYGYHADGYGPAEDHARASIAAYINSEIRQIRTHAFEEVAENGEFSSRAVDRDTTWTATRFAHAELVRFDPDGRKRVDGRYRVFGYLDRQETGRVLLQDYDEAAAVMKPHARQALELARSTDLLAFAAAVAAGSEAYERMRTAQGEYRAITGREIPNWSFDRDLWQDVEQARHERLARLQVSLNLQAGDDTFDVKQLRDRLETALQDLGLPPAAADCPAGGYRLDLRPRFATSGWGPVDATLTLQGELFDCTRQRAVADLYLADPALAGSGPREYDAVHAAAASADAALLARLLAGALGEILPVR